MLMLTCMKIISKTVGITIVIHLFGLELIEGMGNQYTPRQDKDWELLLTKLTQLIDEPHSAAMGNTIVYIGENKPIQRYFYLDVEDPLKLFDGI